MTEILLKELSNQDIDWLLAAGYQSEIEANTILIQQGRPLEEFHILLEGRLAVSLAQDAQNPLGRAFAALEGGHLMGREIAQLSSGEIVGEIPFLETYTPSTTIRAVTRSKILSIARPQILQKLAQDLSFAAHLYRASAVLLASRLEQMMHQLGRSTVVLSQPQLREALIVFAELQDSDIDWLIAAGRVHQIAAGTTLIRRNRPIEALHILLDGAIALTTSEEENNPLATVFSNLEENPAIEKEFARLSRGDIIGETPFVEAQSLSVNVRAVKESQVLSIPQWRLSAKLLHDLGFAARFYRVLAMLLADKQQAIVSRLGYGRLSYSQGKPLNSDYANELSSHFLTQIALAGARFEWMLQRIRIN
jgi:bacteriocin-type transport-associated protein